MGQSLVGGLIGGAGGAISGFLKGGPTGALVLGAVGFVGGFASSYLAKQATADALSSAMGPSSSEPKFGGYTVTRKGAALHHQIIYGQTKVGGVVVFDDAGGTNNKYLSRIIAFAGHEIESFEKIYIGGGYRVGTINSSTGAVTGVFAVDENGADVGSELTGSSNPFNGYLSIREVLGGHSTSLNGQTLSNFSSLWTANHKLLGIAHLAIVFEYADNVWDEGLPEVTALIKGKKVYDPRTSTIAWSANPALIVRDFLTDTDYGLGESTGNIDDTLISTAAGICEATDWDTNAPERYTCNGAWTTSQPPVDVIAQLMTSCAGYLWYAQGKWRLKAGKYVAPTVTLTEDDLRSPLSVSTRHSRRDNFNAVRGTFRGPATNYQFTDYPTVTSSTFVTVDGGLESTMDLALPFTDTPDEAQRLATIALEKNRSQITVTGSFGLNAFSLQVGDNVNITNSRFGWTNKLFEVVAWGLSVEDYQLQINLVLRETTITTYDEFLNPTGFESDNTNLPGAIGEVVIDTGVSPTTSVTGLLANGGIRQIEVSWTNPINDDYSFTRVFYNTSSTLNLGLYTDQVGESVRFDVGANVTLYVWAQAYDTSNNNLGSLIGSVNATSKRSDTSDIVDNAVSEQESSQTTGQNFVGTSYVTVAQQSISNPTGADILVQFSATVDVDNNDCEYGVRITRNGTQIWSEEDIKIDFSSSDRVLIAANYRDTGAISGTNTYRLQLRKETGSGSLAVENRMLIATELKK